MPGYIEQYWIYFNRNTIGANYHFIREGHLKFSFLVTGASCHTTFNCMKSDIQTQLNENISCNVRKYNLLEKSFTGRKNYENWKLFF